MTTNQNEIVGESAVINVVGRYNTEFYYNKNGQMIKVIGKDAN